MADTIAATLPGPTVAPAAATSSFGLPQLSLTGNLIGLAINAPATWWLWKNGHKIFAVVTLVNSLYFVGQIQKQV